MADQVIDIPGVGQVSFPDSMPDAEIEKAAAKLYAEHRPASPSVTAPAQSSVTQSTGASLAGPVLGGAMDLLKSGQNTVKPIIGKAAQFVADTPIAQRVIGRAAGAGALILGKDAAPLVKKAAEGMAAWAATRNATVGRNALGQFTKLATPAAQMGKTVLTEVGGMLGAESDVLSRLNDPTELAALQDRLAGKSSDRQPDYIDTLAKWFGTVKAAQQVAPNTVLSATEIKQLNQLVENGIPAPIATQTILQLRQGAAR